jgi:hypothetical protein
MRYSKHSQVEKEQSEESFDMLSTGYTKNSRTEPRRSYLA